MELNVTIKLDDLDFEYFEDGTISEQITQRIIREIKNEIISNINKNSLDMIKKIVTEKIVGKRDKLISEKVKNVFENEKFELSKGTETTLNEYVKGKIQNTYVVDRFKLNREIEKAAETQSKEFKLRYDNMFAIEIIKKLNENKMLSEKAEKLLFDEKTEVKNG